MTLTETKQRMEQEAKRKGWKLIANRPVSDHPADSYLMYAVIQNDKGEFVSYLFNGHTGFVLGHYYTNEADAMADYLQR
jgi:hypothetical protein